ncbi:MAG: hypothetical protein ACKO9Q_12780 [Pirellula sp.]
MSPWIVAWFRTGNLTTPMAGSKRAMLLAAHMRINPMNFMIALSENSP